MLLGKDKKPAALIVASMEGSKDESEETPGETESKDQMAFRAAASDLIDAIKEEDDRGVAAAMLNFFCLAQDRAESEGEEESEIME